MQDIDKYVTWINSLPTHICEWVLVVIVITVVVKLVAVEW